MVPRLRSVISLFTCWCFLISTVSAAPENIGLLMTTGKVQVDGEPVPGNAAVFSGNRIASGDGIANLRFADGTSAVMRPDAQMTIYREHSVMVRGVTMQRGADKHPVIADGLRISGRTPNAAVLVGVKDESHFEVAAEGGELEVRTPTGNLIARVVPGKNLGFTISKAPDEAQGNTVLLCGRLGGNDQLTDNITSVTYLLQSPTSLGTFHDKTVAVTGTVVNSTATPPVVGVSSIKIVASCEVAAPGAGPAATHIVSSKWLYAVAALAAAGIIAGVVIYNTGHGGPSPATPAVP